ncbi:MAG: PKD domain-containing protein [Colwellia sp.]|nr:PKD domain-containing protein [Colwellia sp.]
MKLVKILTIAALVGGLVACVTTDQSNGTTTEKAISIASVNFLDFPFSMATEHKDSPAAEGVNNLFDGDKGSKFLAIHKSAWVIFKTKTPKVLTGYQITSGGDAPGRDPKEWTLEASNDGTNWTTIDIQSEQAFTGRRVTNQYQISGNTTKYSQYRYHFTQTRPTTWGDTYLQIAELELQGITSEPVAQFSASATKVKFDQAVTFTDESPNSPTEWQWTFENATPTTSNKRNPKVVFNKPGGHDVTLTVKNKFGTHSKLKKRFVVSYDPANPWQGFYYPKVMLAHQDTDSEGFKRVNRIVPDLTAAINEVSLEVCKYLYRNITEVPEFETVTFQYNWSDVLAARGGSGKNMQLYFSTRYLQYGLAEQPDDAVKYEIYGVLWHELVHGYQSKPETIKDVYSPGHDYYAFLEGVADLVRIRGKHHLTRSPDSGRINRTTKVNDRYLSGYTTTGFFLNWIADNYDSEFAYKFNQSPLTIKPWSFKAAINDIINEDVDDLWNKYTAYVDQYNKKHPNNRLKLPEWKGKPKVLVNKN